MASTEKKASSSSSSKLQIFCCIIGISCNHHIVTANLVSFKSLFGSLIQYILIFSQYIFIIIILIFGILFYKYKWITEWVFWYQVLTEILSQKCIQPFIFILYKIECNGAQISVSLETNRVAIQPWIHIYIYFCLSCLWLFTSKRKVLALLWCESNF